MNNILINQQYVRDLNFNNSELIISMWIFVNKSYGMSLTQTLYIVMLGVCVFIYIGVNLERWINEFFKRQVGIDKEREVIEWNSTAQQPGLTPDASK